MLLVNVFREMIVDIYGYCRLIADRRPNPRDLDAGRGDDAAEAAGLRHGGGGAADVRRRHQAEPGTPAAGAGVEQRARSRRGAAAAAARRHRHPRPARRGAAAAPRHRPHPPLTDTGTITDTQDTAASVQTTTRHQMKAQS